MRIQTFNYKRGPKPPNYKSPVKWVDEEVLKGTLIDLNNPLGCHLTISLYDGEVIITLQWSGGHKLTDPTLTILKVDDSVKIIKIEGDPIQALKAALDEVNPNIYETILYQGLLS